MAGAAELAQWLNARRSGKDWIARCPVPGHGKGRGDRSPSLSIGEGKDGKVLLHCHAGCDYRTIAEAVGLTNGSKTKPTTVKVETRPATEPREAHGNLVATYDYTDENGEILYQKLRYNPKTFKLQRPDGKGGWLPGMGDVRRVPYRLPEILKGSAIFLAEGEKDVEALRRLDFTATSSKDFQADWVKFFKGKYVYVIPDNDAPGAEIARKAASLLYGGAEEVHLFRPFGNKDGCDVSDFIRSFGVDSHAATQILLEKITDSTPWEPPKYFGAPADIEEWLDTDPAPRVELFEGLLIKGIVGGIIAQGGVGKTFLFLSLNIAAALGRPLFRSFRPSRPMRVLAHLGEDPEGEIHRRFKAILKDFGDDIDEELLATNLRVYCGTGAPLMKLDDGNPAKTEAFTALKGEVESFQPDLIVIDPKSMFYGLDENNNDHNVQWVITLRELTTWGASVLYSHHASKALASALELNASRGGGGLVDNSRFIANMRQLTDDDAKKYDLDEPWRYVEFKVTKNSYIPKLPGSIFFKFTEGGGLVEVDLKATREYLLVEDLISALIAEAQKGNYPTRREVERDGNILPDHTQRDRKKSVELALSTGRISAEKDGVRTILRLNNHEVVQVVQDDCAELII